jgi:hypothetical protein
MAAQAYSASINHMFYMICRQIFPSQEKLNPHSTDRSPMKSIIKVSICAGILTLASSLSLLRATTPIIYPADSGMIDITKAPYTADPTGATDSTATIQAAVTANIAMSPTRTIYFPAGTYKISSTINCIISSGAGHDRMSFQGAGRGVTILQLTSNNSNFQSTTTPAGVLHLQNITTNGAPNDGFQNNVWDMTIDVGTGNPGAIGIDWSACNLATVRDVTVQSSDPSFKGYAGIYCDGWPGPCLAENVTVTGFNYGIYVRSNQLGVTLDNITLTNQTLESPLTAAYGIYNNGNGVFMRNVTSTNAVSALYAGTSGLSVMTNCNLTGTSSSVPAIAAQATNTPIYLRHVTTSGYSALVKSGSTVMESGSIPTGEYSSQPTARLFNNAEAGLILDPAANAPEYYDSNLSDWASVVAYGADPTGVADSTSAVQAAINSGKTTVYFPLGTYKISGTVNVNGNVVEIFGNQSVINCSAPATNSVTNPGTIFNIENGTSSYVILDRLTLMDAGGVYNGVNQATTREVIIRDSALQSYANSVTGGTLYMENNENFSGTLNQMTAYLWQVDAEQVFPKIVNNDSNLWILGLKTENATTAINTINSGKTEVLGGFMFSNSPTWHTPVFINNNSQFFGSFEEFNSGSPGWKGFFADLIRETQSGATKDLRSWDTPTLGFVTSYSDNSGTPVNAVPTASITSPADGTVFTAGSNITITDTASASAGTLASYVLEDVQPLQAQNAANILATSSPSYTWNSVPAGNYTLYVKATETVSGANIIGYSAPVHIIVKPNLTATGGASMEYWEANGQHWVPDSFTGLLSQLEIFPNFISDLPDLLNYPTSASAVATGRNLGMRIHGYIQPPTTGSYTFSISSSNTSALWMTTDSSNPGNIAEKQLIATNDTSSTANVWTAANTSTSINLTAGENYYFEADQAYSTQDDTPHVEVGWTGPSISQEVIPGTNLLPFDPTVSEAQSAPPAGTIYPEADDWVRGGGTENDNFGTEPILSVTGKNAVENESGYAGLMTTYSRYNLSGITGTITSAILWMYVDTTVSGSSDTLAASSLPGGDTWAETGLNFVNAPASTTSTAGPWTPVEGQWVQVNVTSLVQSAYATDPNKRFSFAITDTASSLTGSTVYSSKEDVQTYWPHLVVTTANTTFVTGETLGTLQNGHVGGVGFEFTVGSSPITVYSLGRWVAAGNSGTHAVSLVQVSNGATVGTVTVNTAGATAGAFTYTSLGTPVVLSANTAYYLLSQEASPGDQWYSGATALTTTTAGTITNAEDSASGGRYSAETAGSYGWGPVDFTYGP